MAILKLYNNGLTFAKPGLNNQPPKRGVTKGWTQGVSRRMTQWLYSVGTDKLTGYGYSFTFTVRNCPPSSSDWSKLVHNLTKRLKRLGATRYHWLTEWQRRGTPHLHGCIYFESEISPLSLMSLWVDLASSYEPNIKSQNVKSIYDDMGWYKYLSKHCVRGVMHYQRNPENIPKEWKTNTGRMWGKGGDWFTKEADKIKIPNELYYKVRRVIKNYRVAKARDELSKEINKVILNKPNQFSQKIRDLKRARVLFKSNNKKLSNVRGGSEFVSPSLRIAVVNYIIYEINTSKFIIEVEKSEPK